MKIYIVFEMDLYWKVKIITTNKEEAEKYIQNHSNPFRDMNDDFKIEEYGLYKDTKNDIKELERKELTYFFKGYHNKVTSKLDLYLHSVFYEDKEYNTRMEVFSYYDEEYCEVEVFVHCNSKEEAEKIAYDMCKKRFEEFKFQCGLT